MGYWTIELDGRAIEVVDGSLSDAGACAYGATKDYLASIHEGDGKPILDERRPYHPFIRSATLAEIRLFEARQRRIAEEEETWGGPVDLPEDRPRGCRGYTLIQVFDMPNDDEMMF